MGPRRLSGLLISGAFERLKHPLFLSLVADRLGTGYQPSDRIFGSPFKIVPKLVSHDSALTTVVIETSKGVFTANKAPLRKNDISMYAVDFFDWNIENWREFRYYSCHIESFRGDPSLVGQRALVEVLEVDVLWQQEPKPTNIFSQTGHG